MSKYNELVLRAWDDWEQETGAESGSPDDFIAWASRNGRLAPQPRDVNKILRRQVTTALRQAVRVDDNGITYRAKQSVTLFDDGAVMRRFFDTDTGGTTTLRQKSVKQRREAVANHVYRAVCDVDHMNSVFPSDPQLSFFADFHDDVAEKRAADLAKKADDDDEEDDGDDVP